jgi:hypothetical protein
MHPFLRSFLSRLAPRGVLTRFLACVVLMLLALGQAWSKPSARSSAAARSASPAKAAPAQGSAAASASPRVDSSRVHRLYLDGEFDAAIAILEDNLKETRQYRHEDSVFIFKHLGVMYAAQYETREKGKYYMHKLLSVEPTVRIMDMYASDMIYMIFKNIQEEFEQNRELRSDMPRHAANAANADSMPARQTGPVAEDPPPRRDRTGEEHPSGKNAWVWTGAAVAAVAVGVGAYFLMSAEPQTTVKDREVDF